MAILYEADINRMCVCVYIYVNRGYKSRVYGVQNVFDAYEKNQ